MKLKERNCYSCESTASTFFDAENGYNLVKCSNCGLLYVNPRPDDSEISAAVVLGVHKGEKDRYVTGKYAASRSKRYLSILRDLYPRNFFAGKKQSWLDIGCGFGEFMEALKTFAGPDLAVSGVDPNEIKIGSAKERGHQVSTEDIHNHTGKYDFLSLLNVYSHLTDPVEFFSDLKKNLKPGGEFLVQTGHVSHIPVKEFPRPYDLPDHLSFANKEIVTGILEKLGFEIVDVKIYRGDIYPRLYEVIPSLKLLVKILIRRGETLRNFYPKYPDIDMYIRCRLKP